MKKTIPFLVVLFMMWACLPSLVSAHAYIAQSTPFQDAELTEAPAEIRITFTEKIDTKLSQISLQSKDSAVTIVGTLSGENDLTLIYTIPELANGVYDVSWQVLSLDSHITDGNFQFAVGVKLAQTKPGDTISLDGHTSGPIGNDSDKGTKTSDTPKVSVKPEQIIKPSITPKPAVSQKPSITSLPIVKGSESPSSIAETNDVEGTTELPIATTEELESNGANNGNKAADSNAEAGNNRGIENEDAAAEAERLTEEASNNHGSHGNASSESDANEEAHDHAGGNSSMVMLRVLDVLVAILLFGVVFFRYVIWRDDISKAPFGFSLRAEKIIMASAAIIWIISGLSRLSMLSDQFGGITIYELASATMVGKIATLRPLLAVIALILAFAPTRDRWWANVIKFAAAAAIIVTFPLTGHANAVINGVVLAISMHAIHMTSAAIWFGGLAGLFSLTFHSNGREHLNQSAVRFAIWALPTMVVMIISGVWLTVTHLPTWGILLTTTYGRLVIAKCLLLLLVLVIAAMHKIVFMRCLEKSSAARGLLIGIRIEVLLAVALIMFAGWLSTTSPPEARTQSKLSEPIYWHVMGEQAHMSLRISEDEETGDQTVRLDVWMPEGQGAPQSVSAAVGPQQTNKIAIPLELQPQAEERFEYPGFTKYTYRSSGQFVDDKQNSLMTVDVKDAKGNDFHYERAVGNQQMN